MQLGAINRRAQQKYATFVGAMDMVMEALENLKPLIDTVDDAAEGSGWTVVSQDELTGYRQRAADELDRLRAIAKKYEAELISREWRL